MTRSQPTREILRVRNAATVLLCAAAIGGQTWGSLPAGRGALKVAVTANAICPQSRASRDATMTIAGSAHALDRAVFDRTIDAVFGTTQCHEHHQAAAA